MGLLRQWTTRRERVAGREDAIERAVQYVCRAQAVDGIFPGMRSADPAFVEWSPSHEHYTTLVIVCALRGVRHPALGRVRRLAAQTLLREMTPPGLWRFNSAEVYANARYPWPLDVDDTALGSMAFRKHRLDLWLGRNAARLLRAQDANGLFVTWLEDSAYRNPVCAVVNANAVWYLGERPETAAAIRWLCRVAEDRTEQENMTYYHEPMHFAYAVSRAAAEGVATLRTVGAALVQRVEESAPAGEWTGSELGAAQALCTLVRSGFGTHRLVPALASRLIGGQSADGSWSAAPAWSARLSDAVRGIPDQPRLHWGSPATTTAVALEALALL